MRKKLKEIVSLLLIIAISYFVVVWFSRQTLFMNDDNGLQFIPIFESAISQFINTGRLPQYNFYQLKGFDIVYSGYYGFSNPIMYIAYFLRDFFSSTAVSYYFLSILLGNFFNFFLVRKLGANQLWSILFVVAYTMSAVFFNYSYWYYSINNFWIYPLFFLLLISFSNNKRAFSYFVYGILMSVSLYMGNAQFAFYFWIFVILVMITYWIIQGDKRWIIAVVSNCIVSAVSSTPALVALWKCAQSSPVYSSRGAAFFGGSQELYYYLLTTNFTSQGCNIVIYVLFLVGLVLLGWKLIKRRCEHNEVISLGTIVATLFFISFLTGQNGIVAPILFKVPVISGFRYLFKILLVLPGCYLFLAANTYVDIVKHLKNIKIAGAFAVCTLFILYGSFLTSKNAVIEFGFSEPYWIKPMIFSDGNYENIQNHKVDLSNYRYINLINLSDVENENYYMRTHDIDALILGNTGTSERLFSLGGYDNTYNEMAQKSAEKLYLSTNIDVDHSDEMFSVRNTVSLGVVLWNICNQNSICDAIEKYMDINYPDMTYDIENVVYDMDSFGFIRSVCIPCTNVNESIILTEEDVHWTEYYDEEILNQLIHNGIKYMLFDCSDKAAIEDFLYDTKNSNIVFSDITEISENMGMIELLNNVNAVVVNQDGEKLDNLSSMDQMEVCVSETDTECHFSLVYSPKIKCHFRTKNLDREIPVQMDEYGDMWVDLSDVSEKGIITLVYYRVLDTAFIVLGFLSFSLLFGLLLVSKRWVFVID